MTLHHDAELRPALRKLVSNTDLSDYEISRSINLILEGKCSDALIASFLVALTMKGETSKEIASAMHALRDHSIGITPSIEDGLIDTCGTGGDTIKSFNISTAAAFVASAAGCTVAKHGNRSVSSHCGSADFLESMGLDLDCPTDNTIHSIEKNKIGFLYAPKFHPALKFAAAARREIGIRTIFNIIGPLCNPCTNLSGQVIGVFEPRLLDVVGEAIQSIGRSEVMVIHAHDGFDELSNTCENDVIWIADGQLKRIRIHPKVIGMRIAKLENIVINSREESIRDTLRAIYGTASTEKQDIVVLNAAAALVVNKIADNIKEGVELARAALREGSPQKKLFALIQSCGNVSKLKEAEQEFL